MFGKYVYAIGEVEEIWSILHGATNLLSPSKLIFPKESLIFRSFPIYLEPLAPRRSPIYQVT